MRNGFTLVELLVALAIFGLLGAAGVAILGQSVTAQARLGERNEEIGRFTATRALMRNDIEQAALRPTRDAAGRSSGEPLIGGGGEGAPLLALVRRGWENPDGAPRASLQYVEYWLVEGRLERRARPALDGAPLGPAQVLLTDVSEAELAFRTRGAWVRQWPAGASGAQPGLPQAVRIDLVTAELGRVRQLFLLPGDV